MKNWMYVVIGLLLCAIAIGGFAALIGDDSALGDSNNGGYDIPFFGDDDSDNNGTNGGGNTSGTSLKITLNEYALIF